jgi:eukaryotic-like serine/threonine-protein kinase
MPPSDEDSMDLGLMAYERGLVSREVLLGALRACASHRELAVGRWLVNLGALQPEQLQKLKESTGRGAVAREPVASPRSQMGGEVASVSAGAPPSAKSSVGGSGFAAIALPAVPRSSVSAAIESPSGPAEPESSEGDSVASPPVEMTYISADSDSIVAGDDRTLMSEHMLVDDPSRHEVTLPSTPVSDIDDSRRVAQPVTLMSSAPVSSAPVSSGAVSSSTGSKSSGSAPPTPTNDGSRGSDAPTFIGARKADAPGDSGSDPGTMVSIAEKSAGEAALTARSADRFIDAKEFAKGGLGVVSRALDLELHRTVALKQIQRKHSQSEDAQARFVREAEITGQLEHPGVVPVYSLGKDKEGRPYYAMKFIEGEELRKHIDRFHKGRKPVRADFDTPEFRQMLKWFVSVCDTMQFAHDRAVLHRDLKPSNIMVGKYGEVLVVDWGLAKRLGAVRAGVKGVIDAEATFVPNGPPDSATAPGSTMAGATMGTPQYMSPEQASGAVESLGPPTDIYALAATLYHILAGQASILPGSLAQVLKKVRTGDIVRPREVNPAIPLPLEAICRKGMALDTEHRYPTARALAEDVERWLADTPVSVLRESVADRARRFARRHRTAVLTAAGGLVAVALVASVATVLVAVSRNKAIQLATENGQLAKKEAAARESAESLADRNRKLADQEALARRDAELARDLESRAKKDAVAQKEVAEDREQLAQAQLYANKFQLAQNAWREERLAEARQLLTNTEPAQRGWEAAFLTASFDSQRKLVGRMADSVSSVAISPDAELAAVSAIDGTLALFRLEDRKELWRKTPGQDKATGVAFSPKGDTLVVCGWDKACRLLKVADGTEVGVFAGHKGQVSSVAFSPDGVQAVSADFAGRVFTWDTTTFMDHDAFGEPGTEWLSVAWSRNGQWIAATAVSGEVVLWEVKSGAKVREFAGHEGAVNSVDFSLDNRLLATGGDDQTVRVWNLSDGTSVFEPRRHTAPVRSVRFDHGGEALLSSGDDQVVRMWQLRTGLELAKLQGAKSPINGAVPGSKGRRIVTGCENGTVHAWDVSRSGAVFPWDGHRERADAVALSPDGATVVTAGRDQRVLIWDADAGTVRAEAKGHEHYVVAAAISPDGFRLATGSWDKTVRVWDLRTGEPIGQPLTGHKESVFAVAWSQDGTRVISAGHDGALRFWDAATGESREVLALNHGPVRCLARSADGERLAAGCEDGHVALVGGKGGLEREFAAHTGPVLAAAFDTTGSRLVTGGSEVSNPPRAGESPRGIACVWNLSTGVPLATLSGHTNPVGAVLFSRDGKRVFTAGLDGENAADRVLKVWDGTRYNEIATLLSEEGTLRGLALHPDGLRLFAPRSDGALTVWDGRTMERDEE